MKKIHIRLPNKKAKELDFWLLEPFVLEEYISLEYAIDQYRDCREIKDLFKRKGYDISLETAWKLWSIHSDDFCARWLGLDDDAYVWAVLREFWIVRKS